MFFFLVLQPSSSPYNITEKVQQANMDLFSSSTHALNEKTPKVKFKDDLFSFEPDLTDEDVNSIESDHVVEPDNLTLCEYKTVNISQIEETTEDLEEEIDDEEIIESINTDYNDIETYLINKVIEHKIKDEKIEEIKSESSTRSANRKGKKKHGKTVHIVKEVHCKDHCIDKLDFDLPMFIKKLEIHEKPLNLPPLQLLQRKCCDELKQKVRRNLPNYNGLRSEYGLTSRQIDIKLKQKEQLKLKEENHRRILEEYRKRKTQQNEEVFCQWLKEISKRRQEREKEKQGKYRNLPYSLSITSLSNKTVRRIKERPKTANEIVSKNQIKKARRPHTSTCVFIEVPQNLLQKGINIKDLLVTNSKTMSNKLHILTLS